MGETCCCGCCSVETGTIIIAVLDILGAIFTVIKNSIVANLMINYPESISEHEYPGFANRRAMYITLCFVGIVLSLAYGAVSGVLLSGARSRQYRLCMPWLYWNYVVLTLMGIFCVIIFFIFAVNGQIIEGIILLIIFGIFLAIAVYFVMVVQRFVNELKAA